MPNKTFDVVVIGAGPAGYVCAIRCAQLGMHVACIDQGTDEKNQASPGGTCLNVGCIPSKALLDSSHHYAFLCNESVEHGIQGKEFSIDVDKMQQRKQKVVSALTSGVKGLLKKNKVEFIHGSALLKNAELVQVTNGSQSVEIRAKNIVIATGSKPFELDFLPIDQEHILDSTGALNLNEVPKHLGVIGAGVIGLEMASVWSRLGAEVTVWEASDQFLSLVDTDIAALAKKLLTKQGINTKLNCKVLAADKKDKSISVTVESGDGQTKTEVDKLLVAIGRVANTDNLDLDAVKVSKDARGFIEVNENWQTSVPGIYAIGDVIGGAMLAHKGSEEGVAVAELLAGQHGHVNYSTIPWVIYTWPEIAWAGKTEQELNDQGIQFNKGQFPFMALGRARAMGDSDGMIKFLADANTDQLLGVHIIGPNASELIAEAVTALEAELTAEDLARTVHGHPTLSEGLHEAALDVAGRAIHF